MIAICYEGPTGSHRWCVREDDGRWIIVKGWRSEVDLESRDADGPVAEDEPSGWFETVQPCRLMIDDARVAHILRLV